MLRCTASRISVCAESASLCRGASAEAMARRVTCPSSTSPNSSSMRCGMMNQIQPTCTSRYRVNVMAEFSTMKLRSDDTSGSNLAYSFRRRVLNTFTSFTLFFWSQRPSGLHSTSKSQDVNNKEPFHDSSRLQSATIYKSYEMMYKTDRSLTTAR